MRSRRAAVLVVLLATLLGGKARAQELEMELAVIGGYGFGDLYRTGVGLSVGALLGNLYVGGRLVDHLGSTDEVQRGTQLNTTKVTALIGAGELAYRAVTEHFDFRLFTNVGAARYEQRTTVQPDTGSPTETTETATELLITPGVAAILPLQGFKVGLEVQYLNAGSPAFSEDVQTRAVAIYARVIIPIKG
jgi:hypothetical protein